MEHYKLAKVLKPQGLKGELKLKPLTDDSGRFYDLSHIYVKTPEGFEERAVTGARLYKGFVFLKIAGVDSCEAAEALRGDFLYIDRASAKKPEGSYFIEDLIGMRVEDEAGRVYGSVREIFNNGAADVYAVAGKKELMFAAAPGVITEVDERERVVRVDSEKLMEAAVYA